MMSPLARGVSRSLLLLGPAGSGKTTMAALTAPRQPVHIIDIDQKVMAMANLQDAVAAGDLTVEFFNEPLIREKLSLRALELATNKKPSTKPEGWIKIADIISRLGETEASRN